MRIWQRLSYRIPNTNEDIIINKSPNVSVAIEDLPLRRDQNTDFLIPNKIE